MATVALASLSLFPGPASAQLIISTGHVDVGLGYSMGNWDLHIHDDVNMAEYDPATTRLVANAMSYQLRPAHPAFDFLGVPAGASIFWLTEVPNPNYLQIGIGAEDNTPGTFANYLESDPRVNASGEYIQLRLKDFSGPGDFSLWTNNGLAPIVWMATSDGIGSTDAVFTINGSHSDYNWAFTEPGEYQLTFEASAFLGPGATNLTLSGDVVYSFVAVPEPSSMFLVSLAALAGWRQRRRLVRFA
jgi:surface-anchored protein